MKLPKLVPCNGWCPTKSDAAPESPSLVAMASSVPVAPEEQAAGARMMMGLFAVPGDGEDTLTSTIEVKGDGQILANGQRIK